MTFKKSICLQLFLRKNVYEWYCNNVLYTVCKDVLLVCGEGHKGQDFYKEIFKLN